jgi:hypothetical protein
MNDALIEIDDASIDINNTILQGNTKDCVSDQTNIEDTIATY